jgi:hypothetical protein
LVLTFFPLLTADLEPSLKAAPFVQLFIETAQEREEEEEKPAEDEDFFR